MTDRHLHCVYYIKRKSSWVLIHEKLCYSWECGEKKALEYLERVKFNDYPKGGSE